MPELRTRGDRDGAGMIAISQPTIGEPEEKLVLEVLRSGRLAQGPMVERFEEAVRDAVGTRHAIAVNNGTSALIAALLAHGIGPGDEVITSPFTFVATLNAILHAGATPRFVDIGEDFNLDPTLLAAAITTATRAVMPVHLYGYPADMQAITSVVRERDIVIVEDAAQALGASQDDRPVGSFGTGCFSFYATKNLTTGEGGVVTTDDDEVASTLRVLRNQGQLARYEYERPGFNLRMTELQAALGVAQMSRLPEIVEARRDNARVLSEGLRDIEGLVLPLEAEGRGHVFHQYTVRVTEGARLTREGLHRHLEGDGIGCGVYYPRPVFDYPCFRRDARIGDPSTPMAARVADEVLSLPVHPNLSPADLQLIVDSIGAVLR
jgi:dTDP-4-amino-4,6-dideoxygalactose transaminase